MEVRRLHVAMTEPEDVVRYLGHQERHWKAGRSAHALATLWFRANSIPQSVRSMLSTNPTFQSATLIDAFLERQVDLGTSGRHSQTDLLAIVGLEERIAVLAVEAKAGESFGEYVCEWLDGSENKNARLRRLCATLGISVEAAAPLRYQLLHRAASAVYEAKRYRSELAIMLVQSFADGEGGFADFSEFLRAVGVKDDVERNVLVGPIGCEGLSLYAGCLDDKIPDAASPLSYLDDLRRYADRLSHWCARVRGWCDERASVLKHTAAGQIRN
jgi:hypothetical protein